jgi:hypothetical protein
MLSPNLLNRSTASGDDANALFSFSG